MMIAKFRSVLTRIVHLLLLVAVAHQLIGSTIMEGPKPGEPGNPIFDLHEVGGLTSLVLISLFWIWTLVRRRETPASALLPWFSAARRASVWANLKLHVRALAGWQLLDANNDALASAVHGLGLLTVTAMAITGTASLVAAPDLAKGFIEVHKATANLMWAYVVAHASLAIIHQFCGSDVPRQMFFVRPRSPSRRMESTR